MGEFRLEVHEFQDLTRWRWALTGPGGALVADHEVRLDRGCWQFEAFSDLLGYVGWHVAPDRWVEDEARIVAGLGAWIGTEVLGPVAEKLAAARPATVRVIVQAEPAEARSLLFRPLELAHARGKPLALQGVTLVMQFASDHNDAGAVPVGDRLRVLGLFSLPEGGQPLNLRRERHALVTLLTGIAAQGRAAEVRVLQYGVTREWLRDVLEEGEGWDVIHVSGHGAPGELLLETEAGRPDRVTAVELADLLELARERVKLVTVAACWSAAMTAAQERRLLGLPVAVPGDGGAERRTDASRGDGLEPGTMATELAGRLGCAVLGMRYPVIDDFAIALAVRLYDLLARQEQTLPRALGMALSSVASTLPREACPAMSAGTPALFGGRAAGLRLAAPRRAHAESYDTRALKMAGFPPQPERFVGRTGVMARASAALAAASRVPGVLLHGMPGGGKTACALELAYTHEHAFDALVWFKAPDEGRDITGALTDFVLTLERDLPRFQMVHVLADDAKLTAFLPRLTELLEQRRALVVIDNIESLLSSGGEWRDARWGQVVGALCGHRGRGRVVLTSRRVPAGMGASPGMTGWRVEAVDALSLDEALLLGRELPHLRTLIHGELPGIERDVARRLARGVLNVAQGHPKLLELADGQAADPARLNALVQAGDQAWREAGGLPDGFFATGEPHVGGEDYRHVLATWTLAVSEGLTDGRRTLFWFLCCLEDGDRIRDVVEANLADLWDRLELAGRPPDPDESLTALAADGLVTIEPGTEESGESYFIHPGIVAAARARASQQFQEAVDTTLAHFWWAVFNRAKEQEHADATTPMVARAGLAAAPYLMRRGYWRSAADSIWAAFVRDRTRANAAAALPALRVLVATGHVPGAASMLAQVLRGIDPAAAERQMRAVLEDALAKGDYKSASVAAGRLADWCRDSGRLAEALRLADERIDYARRAGFGPWTQLQVQVGRLQVLLVMGKAEQVAAEVQRLRAHMQAMPTTADESEDVDLWHVREILLDAGRNAALALGRWQDALDLGAAAVASQQARGAMATEIARARFSDYGPLVGLGRDDEALALLLECRHAFEASQDVEYLGAVFSALATLEHRRGHGDAAIELQRDGLRYSYLGGNVKDIAAGHNNLGSYLTRNASRPGEALAHHLASALILTLAGAGSADQSVHEAASDLRLLGAGGAAPEGLRDLCDQIGQVSGADLAHLLTVLSPELGAAERVLGELLMRVRELAAAPPTADPAFVAAWDPVIAAILAAIGGDAEAEAELDQELDSYRDSAESRALAAALRRVRAGGADQDLPADEIYAAIVTRALDARNGNVTIPVDLWPVIAGRWWLADIVAGARGDEEAAARARQYTEEMAADPGLAALAAAVGRILDGDRDPGLVSGLDDPTSRAVVETVLYHIGSWGWRPSCGTS